MSPEQRLQDLLLKIDRKQERIDELDVRELVTGLRPPGEWTPPLAWKAEIMAFDFIEDYTWDPNRTDAWGTYFGPMMGGSDKEGRFIGVPDISDLSPEIVEYWEKRAGEATHAVLRARYAGLVWDFSVKVGNKKPPIEMARTRIDAVVDTAARNLHKHETQTIKMLEHALGLACRINDPARVDKVRDAVLAFEDRVGMDDIPGLWVFAYDLLWKNRKVQLAEEQRKGILRKLEDRLARLTNGEKRDPWAAEAAAVRLAEHYRSVDDKYSVRRVLLKYGCAFEKLAEQAAPMLAQAWLDDVSTKYRAFGLTGDADRLLQRIRELGLKVRDFLKPISVETTVTKEEMDDYVTAMMEGSLSEALVRITVLNVPRKHRVAKQIRDLATQAPLMSLFKVTLVDHEGRPSATIGSIEDDLEGRIVQHMAQDIQFSAVFLRRVMVGVIAKFGLTCDQLMGYICQSPLFQRERQPILRAGLSAYLDGKAMHCIHLLVPQIEAGVRTLLQNAGGTVLRPNPMGGYDLRAFGDLLCDQVLVKVFDGEDVPLYFRVLLTDRRGINLRNRVCHGISPAGTLTMELADRVVHTLLILALGRPAEGQATEDESSDLPE